MKRSEINRWRSWGKEFLAANNIRLPDLAHWSLSELRFRKETLGAVKRLEPGWDIADFGSGDFVRIGAVLYTVRNGIKGESITLAPYVAHVFGPKPGTGDVVVGEVSKDNDDHTDNFFLDSIAHFADIEEDEVPLHLLCNEYAKI